MAFLKKIGVLAFTQYFFLHTTLAQDLMGERIRKITGKKTSVYLDKGIFHNGSAKKHNVTLKKIRHSFTSKDATERVVFEFTQDEVPRIYGHISGQHKKINIDLFGTDLDKEIGAFGKGHFVDGINFFPIDKESLSVEIILKDKFVVDAFTLDRPARLVLDIKTP